MDASAEKPKIAVVCGPTATGKSALALALARRYGGELVGADSMQVYEGLTIGTAALTPQQAGGVPQHLVGCVPPQQAFSVADWLTAAHAAIDGILSRGALPVVCGGTGLYIKSLVEGVRYSAESPDPALRAELYARWEAEGGEALLAELAARDPNRAAKLHPNDQKRILRALEQAALTGQSAEAREQASRSAPPRYRALCLGLDAPTREGLYAAINARVDAMLAAGLLAEAKTVWQHRAEYQTAAQAIGYKEFFPYFAGEATLEACSEKLKQATRNYAKRQLTWFRHMDGIHWLDATAPDLAGKAMDLTEQFLR